MLAMNLDKWRSALQKALSAGTHSERVEIYSKFWEGVDRGMHQSVVNMREPDFLAYLEVEIAACDRLTQRTGLGS